MNWCICEVVSQWVSDLVNAYVSEWVGEWVSEWGQSIEELFKEMRHIKKHKRFISIGSLGFRFRNFRPPAVLEIMLQGSNLIMVWRRVSLCLPLYIFGRGMIWSQNSQAWECEMRKAVWGRCWCNLGVLFGFWSGVVVALGLFFGLAFCFFCLDFLFASQHDGTSSSPKASISTWLFVLVWFWGGSVALWVPFWGGAYFRFRGGCLFGWGLLGLFFGFGFGFGFGCRFSFLWGFWLAILSCSVFLDDSWRPSLALLSTASGAVTPALWGKSHPLYDFESEVRRAKLSKESAAVLFNVFLKNGIFFHSKSKF